jgi:hypothetical protein
MIVKSGTVEQLELICSSNILLKSKQRFEIDNLTDVHQTNV